MQALKEEYTVRYSGMISRVQNGRTVRSEGGEERRQICMYVRMTMMEHTTTTKTWSEKKVRKGKRARRKNPRYITVGQL